MQKSYKKIRHQQKVFQRLVPRGARHTRLLEDVIWKIDLPKDRPRCQMQGEGRGGSGRSPLSRGSVSKARAEITSLFTSQRILQFLLHNRSGFVHTPQSYNNPNNFPKKHQNVSLKKATSYHRTKREITFRTSHPTIAEAAPGPSSTASETHTSLPTRERSKNSSKKVL